MIRPDPFAPIGDDGGRPAKRKTRSIVMPVPTDAPAAPAAHFTLGKPSARWIYTDAAGAAVGYVLRFDTPKGKEFRPLTLWRDADGKLSWRWESWPSKRPLYGLQRLAERPSVPVIVTEGEKAADAATLLLPAFAVVTAPNGSKSAGMADWSPLRGRDVTIWPDADVAGLEYAHAVVKCLAAVGAKSAAIVSPPGGVAVGWDAADAVADGWNGARATALIAEAAPTPISSPDAIEAEAPSSGGNRRRTPQRDTLIGLTEFCEFWHDAKRIAYATFTVNGHDEHWPVRSREFRMFLSKRFFEETGGALGGQALEDAIRILEARAVNDGPEYEPFVRVGRRDNRQYVDLCDSRWRGVEITAAGWSIVENPPLKFLRSSSMRPLPDPEAGGMVEDLREFLNVRNDDNFMLVVAWLVAALRERGPYPVLVLNGEQGTGKSVFAQMIRSLVDPSAAPIRAVPKDDRDLVVSAINSWVLAFDNLSGVAAWLADALARLATRGGFATRMLHTDREEFIFDGARPIILNGIPSLTDRADLADRAVTIHLAILAEDARRSEDEMFAAFEAKRPAILGALFDAVSAALRNLSKVKLRRTPRMADFAKWITAAESGLGWEPGAFLDVYYENRRDVIESSFEADPVAVAIRDYVVAEHAVEGWTGTATELLTVLSSRVSEGVRRSRMWPDTPQRLGNRIDRVAPLLRSKGFGVQRRHSGQRHIIIMPPKTG
jgi:putative DNA primase/helicase